jgi:peptidoglycan hydrolase-like protein with peptidoglycan-binding domain
VGGIRDVIDERGSPIGLGAIASIVIILAMAGAIGYNAFYRQAGRQPAAIAAILQKRVEPAAESRPSVALPEIPAPPVEPSAETAVAQPPLAGDAPKLVADPLVAEIQRELAALGRHQGPPDGLATPQTREAIGRYRREYGIGAGDTADPQLLEHIQFNRRITEAARFTGAAGEEADERRRLRMIQTGLAELGYNPGRIDGVLGDHTKEAIRQFERDRSLPVTGTVSKALVEELRKVTGQSSLGAI